MTTSSIETPRPQWQGILVGIVLTAILHLVIQWSVLLWFMAYPLPEEPSAAILPDLRPLMPILFIGASQLVYMIPAVAIAHLNRKPALAKGFIVGGSLTILLNAVCFGLLRIAS